MRRQTPPRSHPGEHSDVGPLAKVQLPKETPYFCVKPLICGHSVRRPPPPLRPKSNKSFSKWLILFWGQKSLKIKGWPLKESFLHFQFVPCVFYTILFHFHFLCAIGRYNCLNNHKFKEIKAIHTDTLSESLVTEPTRIKSLFVILFNKRGYTVLQCSYFIIT